MENLSPGDNGIIPSSPKTCISCGNPAIIRDAPNALCRECREKFIKFPIPLWVKVFGGAIIAIVIFALFTFPENLSIGITFEKGLQAEKKRNYLSAQHYFEETLRKMPLHTEAKAHLLIAAFYNNDIRTYAIMADSLGGKSVDDDELLNQVQTLMNKGVNMFPSDSFLVIQQKFGGNTDSIPDETMTGYINANNDEIYPKIIYAGSLYQREIYGKADSILCKVLESDNENINALGTLSVIKRLEEHNAESLQYCDRLLNINHQSTYGLCSKARTLLKMKKTKVGLQLALQSIALSSADPYGKATLALAYHFNNQSKERDDIIKQVLASKDSAAITYFEFVQDVIAEKDHL